MKTEILWQPTVTEGEPLSITDPDVFIMQMQHAFPRDWPLHLTTKDVERLEGMVSACAMFGNPYMTLLQHLKRHKAITIWPVYGEGAF